MTWHECTLVGVEDDNSKGPIGIFFNTAAGIGPGPGVWTQVDCKPLGVPADVKSVFLSGLLIISGGSEATTYNLTLALRAPGSTLDPGNYLGQTIAVGAASGSRSGFASWVPVVNGVFEYQWNKDSSPPYPTGGAYAVNLSLQSYVR